MPRSRRQSACSALKLTQVQRTVPECVEKILLQSVSNQNKSEQLAISLVVEPPSQSPAGRQYRSRLHEHKKPGQESARFPDGSGGGDYGRMSAQTILVGLKATHRKPGVRVMRQTFLTRRMCTADWRRDPNVPLPRCFIPGVAEGQKMQIFTSDSLSSRHDQRARARRDKPNEPRSGSDAKESLHASTRKKNGWQRRWKRSVCILHTCVSINKRYTPPADTIKKTVGRKQT